MESIWANGELLEIEELSDADRALLAAQWAPTASLVLKRSWLAPGGRVDGLAWIRHVGTQLGLEARVGSVQLATVPDGDVVIALVGPSLEDAIGAPVTTGDANVRFLPLPKGPHAGQAPVRLATSLWRHNERTPVRSLLLASDVEFWQHHRAAVAAGYDGALVLNLRDQVARAGRGAVFVLTEDATVVTPSLDEGAPATPWRELVASRFSAKERALGHQELARAVGVAVVTEAGSVAAVLEVDGIPLPLAEDFVASAQSALA